MNTDILIVGGGLSGLALAAQLEKQGRDWLLIEARHRLGGRILSPKIEGAHFDLGPAWFWPGQPRMAQLARRFDIQVFEQYSSGALVYQDQSGTVQRNQGYSSMQGSLRLTGGMGALIEALRAELPSDRIVLNSPLVSLEQKLDVVVAQAGLLQINAAQVVLAVPPRVLSETVSFKPSLPEAAHKAMEIIPTWMAGQAKIVAVYDRPYWREAGFSGDAMSHHGPMVEIHDASPATGGPYALFGFVGYPPNLRSKNRNQVLELAQAQLVAMFGDGMTKPLDLQMLDWAQEPETSTHLDQASPRFHPAYGLPNALKNVWSGKLIWGSTETAESFGGFLEGALEAAEAAARTVEASS